MRFAFFGAFSLSAADIQAVRAADSRNIANGLKIPGEGYSDQPYIVVASNGAWVCTLTTGKGLEGQQGQHVVATTSRDQGKAVVRLVAIEPDSGPGEIVGSTADLHRPDASMLYTAAATTSLTPQAPTSA